MSTLSKYQQAISKEKKKNSTNIYSEITAQNTETLPKLPARKFPPKRTTSAVSASAETVRLTKISPPRDQAKSPHFMQRTFQQNLASQRNQSTDLQYRFTEFRFAVFEQALADNRSTNKW